MRTIEKLYSAVAVDSVLDGGAAAHVHHDAAIVCDYIDLSECLGVDIMVEVAFPGSASDNVVVSFCYSLDGSTFGPASDPHTITKVSSTTVAWVTTKQDVRGFKLSIIPDGSTDTPHVKVSTRRWKEILV